MGNLRDYITVLSIALAAILGWIRIRRINPAFYPFILCLSIGLLNECISLYLVKLHKHTMINMNINILCEALLCCWLFEKWGLFKNNKKLFYSLLLFLTIVWVSENFIFFSIHYFSSYSYITNSFVLVLLSISQVNELISRERKYIEEFHFFNMYNVYYLLHLCHSCRSIYSLRIE